MAKELTERQRQVFHFICEAIRDEGRPPTVREIAVHFSFKSPKAAADHLEALERKGYISRKRRQARNIEVRKELSPQGIPIVGHIAAGLPILAVENLKGSLSFQSLFGADESTFALQVEGESMSGAGILDGDFVVVAGGEAVQNGAIAAVLLGDEATVKRVFFEGGVVRLVAENPDFEDILVEGDAADVRICGPVKGVVRAL